MSNDYIPEATASKIQEAADLIDIATEFLPDLKKKGKDYVGNCPLCLAQKKLFITPTKGIFKCFNARCDCHGVGAVTFLTVTQGYDFPTALRYIAKKYAIKIPTLKEKAITNGKKQTFRDLQLLESGISNKDQKWSHLVDKSKTVERDRYEAMSIDSYGKVIPGDDMVLNYVGLDGQPMEWRDKNNRIHHLVRVRHQYPHNHLDRNGNPMKYRSPFGSPNAVWLPQSLLQAYAKGTTFDTLIVTEGEKKADKLSISGAFTVGLMGIHNLNYEGMAFIFEQIMKKCQVKDVIFLVDADWQDIGKGENADYRPKSFYSALLRFRDYFYGYKNSGIDLNIFFAYGLDKVYKGIDDLLVRALKGKESELIDDFASGEPEGLLEQFRPFVLGQGMVGRQPAFAPLQQLVYLGRANVVVLFGIQHMFVNLTPSGVSMYANGNPMLSLAWTPETLANLGTILGALPDPTMKQVQGLLPVLANMSLGIVMRFPHEGDTLPLVAEVQPDAKGILAAATKAAPSPEAPSRRGARWQ